MLMDANVKKITRSGTGPISIGRYWLSFGLAFFAVGLSLFLSFLESSSPGGWATTGNVAILVGVTVLLGAIFMCVRFGVILDRRRRTVTTWWGLLVPLHKTEHPFSRSHHVTVSLEERGADPSYEVFPERLEGAGTGAITLQELRDYDKARRLAEEVAKFLDLGIRDRSSGEEVERDAGTLDQSIRQRAKRLGLTSRMPQQPPGARSSVSFGGNGSTATIDIPPLAHWIWFVLLGLLPAGLGAFLIAFDPKLNKDLPDMGRLLFIFLVLLCLILPICLFIAPRHQRLVVSPDGLILTRRGIFGTNTTRLQADEIEEVEIAPYMKSPLGGYAEGRVLVIRSDRGSVELGAARSEKELQWLRDVLVHVLTAASGEKGGGAGSAGSIADRPA